MKRIVPVLALFLSMAGNMMLQAQQTNVGAITGTVRDPTGALVPGAQVVVTNQATNLTQTAVTNESGIYIIQLLPIGTEVCHGTGTCAAIPAA